MLWGILVYGLGSLGCYLSGSAEWLWVSQFIQAFGASTGSVVTQTILRETVEGAKRHAVFAQISAALAFTPAIGPLIGGWVDQSLGFRAVFFTLVILSAAVLTYIWISLPETRVQAASRINTFLVVKRLLFDRRVWGFGFLIGATNGILFSYYAEAPFIFIEFFKMRPAAFGFFGIFVAMSSIFGALLSKRLLTMLKAERIILLGTFITSVGALCFTGFALSGIKATVTDLVLIILYFYYSARHRNGHSQLPQPGADPLRRRARDGRGHLRIGLLRCRQPDNERHELSSRRFVSRHAFVFSWAGRGHGLGEREARPTSTKQLIEKH
ncbi:Major Facilitator Superfamily protein [Paenibacillus sp. cl141a]|nr:Major Facilitator Superfamily protein [Paenibacillus sp. cl141a]